MVRIEDPAERRRISMFLGLRALARNPSGRALIVSAVGIVAVGTVAYSLLEHWSVVDAFYFSVVTLATVGYGDLHPTTAASKLFTAAYIIVGIGILATFIAELASVRYAEAESRRIGPGRFRGRRRLAVSSGEDEPE
jgi:hypothetical protein